MPTRFRKSVKLAPGVRLNFGKQSASVTVGPRGSSVSFGSRGTYANVGLRGTGLSYRERLDGQSSSASESRAETNTTKIGASLELQPDGSVYFEYSDGRSLPDDLVKEAKRQQRPLIIQWLQENCDEINAEIEPLLTIHLNTPPPNRPIVFSELPFDVPKPDPPEFQNPVPKPNPPETEDIGAAAKLLGPLRRRVEERNAERQRKYAEKLRNWEMAEDEARLKYQQRYDAFLKRLDEWSAAQEEFTKQQAERQTLIEHARMNDPAAMEQFLAEMLQSIVWPRETPLEFEVADSGRHVSVNVQLPSVESTRAEEWPSRIAKLNQRDLKLTFGEKSDKQKRLEYVTHIHSILFRIAGEIFYALPTVETETISGYADMDDVKTGNSMLELLVHADIDRNDWNKLNFEALDKIDVVQCFDLFETKRDITKTGIIRPLGSVDV